MDLYVVDLRDSGDDLELRGLTSLGRKVIRVVDIPLYFYAHHPSLGAKIHDAARLLASKACTSIVEREINGQRLQVIMCAFKTRNSLNKAVKWMERDFVLPSGLSVRFNLMEENVRSRYRFVKSCGWIRVPNTDVVSYNDIAESNLDVVPNISTLAFDVKTEGDQLARVEARIGGKLFTACKTSSERALVSRFAAQLRLFKPTLVIHNNHWDWLKYKCNELKISLPPAWVTQDFAGSLDQMWAQHQDAIDMMYHEAKVVGCPMAWTRSRVKSLDRLLMARMHAANMVLNLKVFPPPKQATYEGATVLPITKGFHPEIHVMDFRSLYPSMIIAHKLCISTMRAVDGIDEDEIFALTESYSTFVKVDDSHYVFDRRRKCVIPLLQEELLESRASTKAAMEREQNPHKKRLLNLKQLALKLWGNSMYGVLANKKSLFYCQQLAASITYLGRKQLRQSMDCLRELAPSAKIVYGDTDSLLFVLPADSVDVSWIAAEIAKKLNKLYHSTSIEMTVEGTLSRCYLVRKKQYFGWNGKPKMVGVIKSDMNAFVRNLLTQCVDLILRDKVDEARCLVEKEVRRLHQAECKPEELACSQQIQDMAKYVEMPNHAKLILDGFNRKITRKPMAGDRVEFVACKGQKYKLLCEATEPDIDYYLGQAEARLDVLEDALPIKAIFQDVRGCDVKTRRKRKREE